MARPADVHIDDLADPTFAPEVEEMMAAVAPMAEEIRLEPGALLEQASRDTGLDDFGDERFREPLGVLLRALDTEAGLSAMGRVTAYGQLLQLLKNRLLIQDTLARHPEIRDVRIERPIIIAGLPRTGTTHLHNLVSADPALRSLPYWESLEPVLAEHERPGPGEPDPRLARTEQGLAFLDVALPYFERMHEMTTWHVHEEIQLLAIDFSTMLFETMAVMPSWRDWYKATDQTPSYEYLRTVLQVLQWSRGGTRWVLKSPQHLEQFGPLKATFPDATFVVTHRDPVSITASLATMIAYTARLNHAVVDPARIGRYWADRVEDLLRACVRDRELLPADQSIDVRFHEFMADDVAMVERIYALAGQPMTADARRAMDAFMVEHPRGRHGRVHYDLADFGLDADERRAALRFYVERFDVEEELTPA
jgi:hypothetical protein